MQFYPIFKYFQVTSIFLLVSSLTGCATSKNQDLLDFLLQSRLRNTEEFLGQGKLPKCCPQGYIVQDDPEDGLICVEVETQGVLQNNGTYSNLTRSILEMQDYNVIGLFQRNENKSTEIASHCTTSMERMDGNKELRILHNRNGIWFKISTPTNTTATPSSIKIGLDYFVWAAWIPIDQKSFYCLDLDITAFAECANRSSSIQINENLINEKKSYDSCIDDLVLIFCNLDSFKITEFIIHRYVYGVSSLLTCIPIIITLVLYLYLKIYKNSRKWILISYFSSYCCACGAHGVQIILYVNNLEQKASFTCHLLNHLFVYFAIAFGTACMFVSLDIFYCFWKMNSSLGIVNESRCRIIISLLITWVGTLVLYTAGELWREYFAKYPPDLGWKKCMSLNFDIIEFLIMIQFIFKFMVYLSTSILIYKHKKSTSFATKGAQKDFNESTILYGKLFITTGMPFTCLALDYCFAFEDPMAWYWFLLRFPHSFIGIYIFLVFGLSKEVRVKWKEARMSLQDRDLEGAKNSNSQTSQSIVSKRASNKNVHSFKM